MDRIYEANAAATPPSMAGGSSGYPTDGSLSPTVPPTIPGARWFHQQTEELVNLVLSAGLTLNGAALNQVAVAVQTLISTANDAAIAAAAADATTKANAARSGAVSDVNAEFTGHQNLTIASGFQDYPGAQTHQWVQQSATVGNGDVTISYSKPFTGTAPIPCITIFDSSLAGGSSNFLGYALTAISPTGCTVSFGVNGGAARSIIVRADAWGHT